MLTDLPTSLSLLRHESVSSLAYVFVQCFGPGSALTMVMWIRIRIIIVFNYNNY
jgi:hypothetical protein